MPLWLVYPEDLNVRSSNSIDQAIGVIKNFFNYILYHDVAPEYKTQILASKKLCVRAEYELWEIEQAKQCLPGDFNRACSQIFGGLFKPDQESARREYNNYESDSDAQEDAFFLKNAAEIFKTGFAARATEAQLEQYQEQNKARTIGIAKVEKCTLEVTGVTPSEPEVRQGYQDASVKDLQPIGILHTKTWLAPLAPVRDLTEEEEQEMAAHPTTTQTFDFWVEDKVLKHCFVGMKIDITVRWLSFGIAYFDAVDGLFCSFYEISPNAMMEDWKKVEEEWLPRRKTGGAPLSDDESRGADD